MNLSDNEYFKDVMFKYFLILIEMRLYSYRQNRIYLGKHCDDKPLGIYEAMKEIALNDETVICVNFDINFPVHEQENLFFIDKSTMYCSVVPCDFLFVYGTLEFDKIKKICDYYNPKFIFHC